MSCSRICDANRCHREQNILIKFEMNDFPLVSSCYCCRQRPHHGTFNFACVQYYNVYLHYSFVRSLVRCGCYSFYHFFSRRAESFLLYDVIHLEMPLLLLGAMLVPFHSFFTSIVSCRCTFHFYHILPFSFLFHLPPTTHPVCFAISFLSLIWF